MLQIKASSETQELNTCRLYKYGWTPTYDGVIHDFLTSQWCESDMHSVEAVLQVPIQLFCFFPCSTVVSKLNEIFSTFL